MTTKTKTDSEIPEEKVEEKLNLMIILVKFS